MLLTNYKTTEAFERKLTSVSKPLLSVAILINLSYRNIAVVSIIAKHCMYYTSVEKEENAM